MRPADARLQASIVTDQKLHQIVIDRFAGGLNEEHIRTADGLANRNRNFTICKVADGTLCKRQTQRFADLLSQRRVRVAGQNLDVFTMRNHSVIPPVFLWIRPGRWEKFARSFFIFLFI